MTDKKVTSLNFEENLKALETIVNKMENEPLDLDEALKQFESGIKLTQTCQKALKEAEQKVETLTSDSTNN